MASTKGSERKVNGKRSMGVSAKGFFEFSKTEKPNQAGEMSSFLAITSKRVSGHFKLKKNFFNLEPLIVEK